MNLGDPELELIDPTPNIHSLFVHFDTVFFWTKLASRAVVRWSKRMYTCAGICSYSGRAGLCDIALSEPLLKLRSRKDLVETLLHEMIHAYLFITNRDTDRDGHGPIFKSHMNRINKFAALNITIYHDFHEEVKLYQTHWWRCNGPCQSRRPHFGIVRRTCNRAPGPNDCWWRDHQAKCGGTFVKIKEPEKPEKKTATAKKPNNNPITKYINNNNDDILNKNIHTIPSSNPVRVSRNDPPTPIPKSRPKSIVTVVSTKKDNIVFNPSSTPVKPFSGAGRKIEDSTSKAQTANVTETVRDIWAKKQLPTLNGIRPHTPITNGIANNKINLPTKNKRNTEDEHSSPNKIKKIDDYFKDKASSILKDVYGQDFQITQPKDSKKLVAVTVKLVTCPVCNTGVADDIINRHLDECLNKDVLEKLSKENIPIATTQNAETNQNTKQIVQKPVIPKYEKIPEVSKFKIENSDIKLEIPDSLELSFMDELLPSKSSKGKGKGKSSSKNNEEVKEIPMDTIATEIKESTAWEVIKNTKINKAMEILALKNKEIKEQKQKEIKEIMDRKGQLCSCCNKLVFKPMDDHLDECLKFFENDETIPYEGTSTSMNNIAIIIDDDDDLFDETLTMNPTGTKTPCPCCLKMIEQDNMNDHLDLCLQ